GSGALIGCAAVPARPGRSITVYVTFGVLMGYAFWIAVSAVNLGQLLDLVPPLLLAVGAAWFLQKLHWPSALFTRLVIPLNIGLAVLLYQNRPAYEGEEATRYVHTALTSFVVLGVGLVYLVLSFAEARLYKSHKSRRTHRRAVLRQADPSEPDEHPAED